MKRVRFSSVGAPQRLDLVEKFVIEHLLHIVHAALEQAEIHHHPGRGIGCSANADLGAKRMAVNFLAGIAQRRSGQRMRGLETEGLRQFPHRDCPVLPDSDYLMPSVLCV